MASSRYTKSPLKNVSNIWLFLYEKELRQNSYLSWKSKGVDRNIVINNLLCRLNDTRAVLKIWVNFRIFEDGWYFGFLMTSTSIQYVNSKTKMLNDTGFKGSIVFVSYVSLSMSLLFVLLYNAINFVLWCLMIAIVLDKKVLCFTCNI